MVKNLPAMWEICVSSLRLEDPLEGMATTPVAWRVPMDRGAWWLQSMGSQSIRHDWVTKHSTNIIWLELSSVLRRRRWHPTPVLLPGKSHGWRSVVSCSPRGHEELDTTERLHFHFSLFSLSFFGEGNGNPLPCSCLENPRDSGAWWAAVYGVA